MRRIITNTIYPDLKEPLEGSNVMRIRSSDHIVFPDARTQPILNMIKITISYLSVFDLMKSPFFTVPSLCSATRHRSHVSVLHTFVRCDNCLLSTRTVQNGKRWRTSIETEWQPSFPCWVWFERNTVRTKGRPARQNKDNLESSAVAGVK